MVANTFALKIILRDVFDFASGIGKDLVLREKFGYIGYQDDGSASNLAF
jgi:hypothetical protein